MNKYIRVLGIILLITLAAGLLWFGNAMMGNPISHTLATKAAKAYMSDQFSDTDYEMET